MYNLDCENTIYDNLIEYYFHDFFEVNNIDITGLNFKNIPNSTYKAAFRYIYNKLFKPDKDTIKLNNKNTKIDLNNIEEIEYIYNCYVALIEKYNITAFIDFFITLIGINNDTFYSWLHNEYDHGGLSARYSDLCKNVQSLAAKQVRNKLSDDRIGLQSLANNDIEVGLNYARNEAYNKQLGENTAKVSLSELKTAFQLTQK